MTASPVDWISLHEGRLSSMIDIADAAGKLTLQYFRRADLAIDAKKDDSPVTIADREAEQLVRKLLSQRFPHDAIEGEEFEDSSGTTAYRWIVDPIDGTKSFVCGVPLYSTLLALEFDGVPIGGVIFIPALGEMIVAAKDQGSWFKTDGLDDWKQARVSKKDKLSEAVFVVSQVDSFGERGFDEAYRQLEKQAWVTRSWGDGYGYLLVATGRADIMIDPICNPWDVAPCLPVINEAGGVFTDWKSNSTVRGGDGVGTNDMLHHQVIEMLSKKR